MHILITNDDGYRSPGLAALRSALLPFGDVTVLAPERNWTAAGLHRRLFDPLRISDGQLSDGSAALVCDGTPADCVGVALMGLIERPIDLVVSGINLGANLGTDVNYSGTVAAAMEGHVFGVPSLAVSQWRPQGGAWDFRAAQHYVAQLVTRWREQPPPSGAVLSLNLPVLPLVLVKGLVVARLGRRVYHDQLIRREDPHGRPYYWVGGGQPEGIGGEGTDVAAIAQGYATLTPLHMDLTAHDALSALGAWLG